MKWLIILLLPLFSFSQWKYQIKFDSISKTSYPIATNKNLSLLKTNKELILRLDLDTDKHIRRSYMNIKLVFITEDSSQVNYEFMTTGKCNRGFITITTSLHTQQYLKHLKLSNKIEIHIQVQNDVMWLTYYFDSNNFNEAYKFIIQH